MQLLCEGLIHDCLSYLSEAVLSSALVRIGDHRVVRSVVVAEFEVMREKDVAEGRLVSVRFRADAHRRGRKLDHVICNREVAKL